VGVCPGVLEHKNPLNSARSGMFNVTTKIAKEEPRRGEMFMAAMRTTKQTL
jgi:hypothetical protein